MTNPSDQTLCFFCHRVLSPGEGRYRLFQKEKELDCCPACFDSAKLLPRPVAAAPLFEHACRETETER